MDELQPSLMANVISTNNTEVTELSINEEDENSEDDAFQLKQVTKHSSPILSQFGVDVTLKNIPLRSSTSQL